MYRQKLSNADISVLLADTAHWVHSLICTNCEQYVFISTINIDGVKNLYKLKTVILWTLVPIIGGRQNDFHHYPPLSHDQFPLEIDFGKKITPDRNPSSLSNIWLFQSHVNILERFLHSLRLPVHLCLITRPFQSAKKNSLFVGHLWVRTNLVQFQLRWQKLRYYLVFRHAVAIVCEHVNQKFCFSLTPEF